LRSQIRVRSECRLLSASAAAYAEGITACSRAVERSDTPGQRPANGFHHSITPSLHHSITPPLHLPDGMAASRVAMPEHTELHPFGDMPLPGRRRWWSRLEPAMHFLSQGTLAPLQGYPIFHGYPERCSGLSSFAPLALPRGARCRSARQPLSALRRTEGPKSR